MTGWEHALADLEHATRRLADAADGDWMALARTLDDRGAAAIRLSAEDFQLVPVRERADLVARVQRVSEAGGVAAQRLREAVGAAEAESNQWGQLRSAFGGGAPAEPARIDCDG